MTVESSATPGAGHASSLPQQLIAKASGHAARALEGYRSEDWEATATEAAISLELTAKAVLSAVNPILIADFRDFESVLHLSGHASNRTQFSLRTATAADCLQRAARIVPLLRWEAVRQLVESRNAAVHFLGADPTAVRDVMAPWVHAMDQLASALGVPMGQIYGGYESVATNIGEQSLKESEIRVSSKLDAARLRFRERFGLLAEEGRAAALTALEAAYLIDPMVETNVECPACGREAHLIGGAEVESWEVDYDDEGHPSGRFPIWVLYADQLDCMICGLSLVGADELVAADVPRQVGLENLPPGAFEDDDYEDWRD